MKFIKLTHKWVSLLVVLQLLIWLGSGLYFNLMDHHKAGGHTYRAHNAVFARHSQFMPIAELPVSKSIKEVGVVYLLNEPYFRITESEPRYANWAGQYRLFHAETGQPLTIDDAFAKKLAQTSYNGPGEVKSVVKLSPPLSDIPKERNSVWQVNFDDDIDTSVYLRQQTGQIVAHVDNHRRLRDFFFMLHFMDYANEGSFNNIQIIIMAVFTLWLALTGFIWTLNLIKEGQLTLSSSNKQHKITVDVLDTAQQDELVLAGNTSLFSSLWQHDWMLPSSCGGGGTCGQCRVKTSGDLSITSADKEQFSTEQLSQGWRLACQHKTKDFSHIVIERLQQPLPKHRLKLVAERYISPMIKELMFEPVDGELPTYQAGAHLRFEIPVKNEEQDKSYRHYSLATPAEDTNLVFNIRHHPAPSKELPAGVGSDYLCQLKPGDEVSALGPIEGFAIDENHSGTKVLLGAGSGMAPLRAMILSLLANDSDQSVYFYYGARTEDDLLYFDEFTALEKQYENFHYYPVLSQPSDNWLGKTGYAQEVMFNMQSQVTDFNGAQFYLCGPQSMMQQTLAQLKTVGIDSDAIFWDTFGQPVNPS